MDEETEALLLSCDRISPDEWESPKEWNAQMLLEGLEKVKKLNSEIAKTLNTLSSIDNNIQDASHYAEIIFSLGEMHYNIRFSNFGNLVTVINWSTEQPDIITNQLEQMIRQKGWVVVYYAALLQCYTGKANITSRNFTWFNRFFDYL